MIKSFLGKAARWILAFFCLWFIGVYLYVSLIRLRFPFQLEWIEGAMVDQALRFFRGQPMYVEPGIDFIPQIYPPLYYYLSALAMKFTGPGFLPLRLVSWLASLGFMAVAYQWVRKETGRAELGLLSAGLIAACYKITGSWYDVARVDSLFLFFAMAAAYRIRFAEKPSGWIGAGVLVFLCWFTKQTATTFFLPIFICVFFQNPKRALWIFGVAASLALISFFCLNFSSGGWYAYYLIHFAKALSTGYTMQRFVEYWSKDLWGTLPLACLFAGAYLVIPGKRPDRGARSYYASFLAGAVITSCLARIHWGGSENTLMPVYAGLAVLTGLSAGRWAPGSWPQALIRLLCIAQLAAFLYTPQQRIPRKADYESGERLLQAMREVKGEVYAPRFGYLPLLAGKRTYAQRSMLDLVIFYDPVYGSRLAAEVEEAIRQKRFDAIIFESDIFRWTIETHYEKTRPIQIKDTKFWAQDNARFVHVPKANSPQSLNVAEI